MRDFTPAWFAAEMKELAVYHGISLPPDRIAMMYDRLPHSTMRRDVEYAARDMDAEVRFTTGAFMRVLNEKIAARREQESLISKMRNERELLEVYRADKGQSKCVNRYDCGGCARTICDIVARASVRVIDDLFAGKITRAQADGEMQMFKGLDTTSQTPMFTTVTEPF